MAITKGLGCLRRTGLDEERVRVRQRHCKVVQLAHDPANLRVSVLLCMTDLAHASKLKEHDDNDDFQGTTGRAA